MIDKQPDLKMKYVETINQCIKDGHATKININKRNDKFNNKLNYILHHELTNTNIPWKTRILFDAGVKCQSISLSGNLLKRINLLKNWVGILLQFCQGKFCIMVDIEKMFHQVMVKQRDWDALRLIWRSNRGDNFQDIQINVHWLEKVDSSCCCVWALKKLHQITLLKPQIIKDNFYMDDYLHSFHRVQEAIKVSNDVTNSLSEERFRLTKCVSIKGLMILRSILGINQLRFWRYINGDVISRCAARNLSGQRKFREIRALR